MPSSKSVIELWRAAGTDFSINDIERSIDDRYGCQLNAATDVQIEATIKLVDSIMDDRMERLRAKDPAAAAAEDDTVDEFAGAPTTDGLPLAPPAPPVSQPNFIPTPSAPSATVARSSISRLPRLPIRQQAQQPAVTTAVAAARPEPRPPRVSGFMRTFVPPVDELLRDREERERNAIKPEAKPPTVSGAGRLPASRRPAFLNNLADDDPEE
jgi:hypothetical protein